MSMPVRSFLENFISKKKREIRNILAQVKREAFAVMDQRLLNTVLSLEAKVDRFAPRPTDYLSQEDYIKALKSFALMTSYLSEVSKIFEKKLVKLEEFLQVFQDTLSLSNNLALDLGGIITNCRDILSNLGNEGLKAFLEGSRGYLASLIEFSGYDHLLREEAELLKQYIVELLVAQDKPFLRISEVSIRIGLNEKTLRSIIKKMLKEFPEILYNDPFITTREKIISYVENITKKADLSELINLGKVFPQALEKAYYENLRKMANKLLSLLS